MNRVGWHQVIWINKKMKFFLLNFVCGAVNKVRTYVFTRNYVFVQKPFDLCLRLIYARKYALSKKYNDQLNLNDVKFNINTNTCIGKKILLKGYLRNLLRVRNSSARMGACYWHKIKKA